MISLIPAILFNKNQIKKVSLVCVQMHIYVSKTLIDQNLNYLLTKIINISDFDWKETSL